VRVSPVGFGAEQLDSTVTHPREVHSQICQHASHNDAVTAAGSYLRNIAEQVHTHLAEDPRDPQAIQIDWSVPLDTEVAPAIVLLAERGEELYHPFDLVALSTHGEGGWDRWTLGGVTEEVLWGTPLPMLVVRPASLGMPQPRTSSDTVEPA